MNTPDLLNAQKQRLAALMEAMQRCVYFLHASDSAIKWPLTGDFHSLNKKHECQYRLRRPVKRGKIKSDPNCH